MSAPTLVKRVAAAVACAAVLALAACSSGPSAEETSEWSRFAADRQFRHESAPADAPASVQEYLLGASNKGYAGPTAVFTGSFLGASETPGADGEDHVWATFHIDGQVVGGATGEIVVDLGPAPATGVDTDAAVRGADTCVVFLVKDDGAWALADGTWAIATTDGDGRLSMPLVAPAAERSYLAGVSDVADLKAIAIAGSLDKGGVLGDDGISDTEQSLIDKANEIAGNS